jgi:hypothetical protein
MPGMEIGRGVLDSHFKEADVQCEDRATESKTEATYIPTQPKPDTTPSVKHHP